MVSIKDKVGKSIYYKTFLTFISLSIIPLLILVLITQYAAEDGIKTHLQNLDELNREIEGIAQDMRNTQIKYSDNMKEMIESSVSRSLEAISKQKMIIDSLYSGDLLEEDSLEKFKGYNPKIWGSLHTIRYTVGQSSTDMDENSELASFIINKKISESVVAEQERSERLRLKIIYFITAFFSLMIICIIFISYAAAKSIVGPIKELTGATNRIREGDMKTRIDIKSKDEIGELARTFNDMSLGLKDRNELLNTLLDALKGKTGSIAVILMRKNIQGLIDKNPRILGIIPSSLRVSFRRGGN